MRGNDTVAGSLFSYVDLEKRIRADHPLRVIRDIENATLAGMSAEFDALYSPFGRDGVALRGVVAGSRATLAAVSVCQTRQADDRMVAHQGDGFQGHVSRPLDCQFVVLLQEQCSDQPDYRGFVGEDADDVAAAFDVGVEPFEGVGRVDLGAMLGGELHVGQHVGLGLVHEGRQPGHAEAGLIGDLAPHCYLAAAGSSWAKAVPI